MDMINTVTVTMDATTMMITVDMGIIVEVGIAMMTNPLSKS
ncbi:MAG: hypothetical protein V3U06_06390 [Candidatus Binatia bacterium]